MFVFSSISIFQSSYKPIVGLGSQSSATTIYSTPTYFDGGNGTEISPYLISTGDQLNELADDVNENNIATTGKFFRVVNNLDLSSWTTWTPIGNSTYPFKGTFDGGGYTISNLNINSSSTESGLFGCIENAVIKNIALQNGEVLSTNYVGGIVGYSYMSAITNCTNLGVKVTSQNSISGGIVGFDNGSRITYCKNYAYIESVVGSGSSGYAGGIIGFATNVYGSSTTANCGISLCFNYGRIVSKSLNSDGSSSCVSGGIVGIVAYNKAEGFSLNNCGNFDAISAGDEYTGSSESGGIAGTSNITIDNCFNRGNIGAKARIKSGSGNRKFSNGFNITSNVGDYIGESNTQNF